MHACGGLKGLTDLREFTKYICIYVHSIINNKTHAIYAYSIIVHIKMKTQIIAYLCTYVLKFNIKMKV